MSMNKDSIEILERKFKSEEISHRKTNFGPELSYVEGHRVIRRLNEAFGHNWSFEVIKSDILNEHAVVVGRLSVIAGDGSTIVKDGVGGKQLMKKKNTGDYIDIGNDFKAASTDALKVAARLFGVALHLYEKDEDTTPAEPPEDPNEPADENQKKAIVKLCEIKGVDIVKVLKTYKASDINDLKKVDAKKAITKLQAK